MTTNPKLAKAHRRCSELAHGLVANYGAIDAAGVLIGAAVGVLELEGGTALAEKYLRELADEVERPGPESAARN